MKQHESSPDYCRRRAAEERAAAAHAADERAARAHHDLASHFDALAEDAAIQYRPDQPPQSPGTLPGDFRIIP